MEKARMLFILINIQKSFEIIKQNFQGSTLLQMVDRLKIIKIYLIIFKLTNTKGNIYEGDFENDMPNGKGIIVDQF
jgi:hypothetical protein